MADSTLEYYNKNAWKFLQETTAVDFSETQNIFLEMLPKETMILDFGCGSGRDALEFRRQGFQVEAADGSYRMCQAAGLKIEKMWISSDVRPGREEEKWLNIILRKVF